MNCYGIYNITTGVIRCVLTASNDNISENVQAGESAIILLDDEADDKHYVSNGVVVPYPTKPAEFYIWDYTTTTWIDPRTLADAQLAQWEIVKAARDAANLTGFVWNSMNFQSDPTSQAQIQGAIQLAQLAIAASQPFSIVWTLTDNTTTTLSATDMFGVGVALGTFIQTNYAKGVALRNEINAATSIPAVEAIVWN
ncbi:DUF4376 domain-containing protein [Sapientia aquatica]|uniref:DUF4376 domain-containing protein n=1 Tax=Sapientia aquatica TaxID=1549640 RepID=A0A4R5VXB9_9BURK|nr:DUF4376 domain-containing protein [Sapientia aquatica]TDK63560.1 DUF4376 domain-containing protein [Sapientia aquatica]